MNRRELMVRFAALAGASSVATSTQAEPLEPQWLDQPDPRRTMAVFRTNDLLTAEQCSRIREAWERAIRDTEWEGTRAIVLADGLTLDIERR